MDSGMWELKRVTYVPLDISRYERNVRQAQSKKSSTPLSKSKNGVCQLLWVTEAMSDERLTAMWLCFFLRLPHQLRTFWNERPAERIWRAYIWIRPLKEWTHKLRDIPNICFYDSDVLERAKSNNYPSPNGHRQQGRNHYKIDAAFAASAPRLLVPI